MSFTVYLPEAGVDVGGEVALVVNSDEPFKLLFKGGQAFMINKEDLNKAIEILESHLTLQKPIQMFVPAGSNVIYDIKNGSLSIEES